MFLATARYRARDFYPVLRYAQEDILDEVAYQPAPPGFVIATFTSKASFDFFTEELGPSIEPNYQLDLDDYKDYSNTKKFKRGERS